MTNQDYEEYYNSAFEEEYNRLIIDFTIAFNETKDGYSISKKIQKFGDSLPKRRDSLIRVYYSEDHSYEDNYCTTLIRRFREGREDYEVDQFFLRFLDKEIPEIKEGIKRSNIKIIKPEVFDADGKSTFTYIAKYNACQKLINDYYKISNLKSGNLTSIIEILRAKSELDVEVKVDKINEIISSKNKFNNRSMADVVEHFKVLTTSYSKNGQPFLTNEQLINFLERAFLNVTDIPLQTINISATEKGFVIKRFFEFYNISYMKFGEINKKEKYIKLISNNYDNWSFDEIKFCFKATSSKRSW